ncbi:MAG: LysM peptidoglycan-binding domain-containing protein [Bacteroidetes bacterium]|nr:MAG: LysM peptidoglycan-binding domain-containing protein [Bacteroidota bacterium]
MRIQTYILWLTWGITVLLTAPPLPGQPIALPVAAQGDSYPFLRRDLNRIDNHSRGLLHLYRQLERLERGEVRTVNIVHIGDSHIQADWFSGYLRQALQQRFGSAGRGLVFPYRVAHTNSPLDLYSDSEVYWQCSRAIDRDPALPIGLCGFTLQTRDPHFQLQISLKEAASGLDYGFNKVTLLTDKGTAAFDLELSQRPMIPPTTGPVKDLYHEVKTGESLGILAARYKVPIRQLKSLNHLTDSRIYAGQRLLIRRSKVIDALPTPSEAPAPGSNILSLSQAGSPFATSMYLEEPTTELYLRGHVQRPQQSALTLYGMVLENYRSSGILYHMIGVNGAKFSDYNRAAYFWPQLQALHPDLVIISLGTNETADPSFRGGGFYAEVDQFVHRLEQYLPHADILVTTPPDAYRARRYPNPQVQQARDILLRYALSQDLACWNFYDIMGGAESISAWYQSGLAQGDRLHLTQPGYELAARLLYQAIIDGYGAYRSLR